MLYLRQQQQMGIPMLHDSRFVYSLIAQTMSEQHLEDISNCLVCLQVATSKEDKIEENDGYNNTTTFHNSNCHLVATHRQCSEESNVRNLTLVNTKRFQTINP